MLTRNETLRQVILSLYSHDRAIEAFLRRKILRGAVHEPRLFRRNRRETFAIIHKCLNLLTPLRDSGALDAADKEYTRRNGRAGIDIVMDCVYREYDGPMEPPALRRTKTPLYGSIKEDVDVGSWETVRLFA